MRRLDAALLDRIAVCGWTRREAIAEMTRGGFGFHPVWTNLVTFIERLDVEALKKEMKAQR